MSRTDIPHPTPEPHHLLLVGGGPRSTIQATTEVAFLHLYRAHFEELASHGAVYNLQTTLIEKQPLAAPGVAFSPGQAGMANTGVEDDITLPLPLPPTTSPSALATARALLSYKTRYTARFQPHPRPYYNALRAQNLPGAVMFRRAVGPMSATPCGTLDHSRAYLMRQTMGEEAAAHFAHVRHLAADLPFYTLSVQHGALVDRIAAQPHSRPVARVVGQDVARFVRADHIRLNTGTTLRHPVPDARVHALTFCQPMNVPDMTAFFAARGLLGADGRLLAGARVLCGGLNLSALDQLSALDGVMGLFEEDDNELVGYRVTDRAKELYQGAITFVSRTPGKACPPRHAFTPEWTQETPVLGGTKHLHALFLHENGEQVFDMWMDLLKAAVARATNHTPDELESFQSTDELLRSKFEETRRFLDCRRKAGLAELQGNMEVKERLLKESTQTLSGAWRQAALSVITGFGLESDLEAAGDEMDQFAPITFKGRAGMLLHRAQIYGFTHPRASLEKSNEKLVANLRKMMSFVTASPVEIHSMFHLLFEAGIAKFEAASYSDISCDSTGEYLQLHEEHYDALVVSPVFDRSSNAVMGTLSGQVRAMHDSAPSYGEVGKFRQFISKDGTPIAVEDNGLGGTGFQLREGEGKGSVVGAFAWDINNRASAASTAASFAMRRMAMGHLKAAGVRSPSTTLSAIYERQKPGEEAYDAEVEKFRCYFEEACEMRAYVRAVRRMAGGDADVFRRLYDEGRTAEGRRATMVRMGDVGDVGMEVAKGYFGEVVDMPVFNPPRRDGFLGRFVDTTADEDVAAYEEAFRVAKRRLGC